MDSAAMALAQEWETYRNELPNLSQNEGKFVLIHGDKIVEFFTSYEDALKAGYAMFSVAPFLVKQIQELESVHFIARFVPNADSA